MSSRLLKTVNSNSIGGPWSILGATYSGNNTTNSDLTHNSLFIKSDGLQLFSINELNGRCYSWPISTAWDFSTIGLSDDDQTLIYSDNHGLHIK